MSNRLATILLALALIATLVTAAAFAAAPDPQNAKLRQRLAASASRISDQAAQINAQSSALADQADTIRRLRNRDPLQLVLQGSPDDLWQAMIAIWRATPSLDPGTLCGYDRSNVPGGDDGSLALTSYTFYRWTGC